MQLHFRLDLTEKEIPQVIGKKIYDVDNKTILGTITEYNKETGKVLTELTEAGYRLLSAIPESKSKIGWSVNGSYLSENNFNQTI